MAIRVTPARAGASHDQTPGDGWHMKSSGVAICARLLVDRAAPRVAATRPAEPSTHRLYPAPLGDG